MPVPKPCLVDTNVAIVANGHSEQASEDLTEKCIDALLEIINHGKLVLDDDGRIFDEYGNKLNLSGQPGTGDFFYKWVFDHQWIAECCDRRSLTCLDENEQIFSEFPKHSALVDFDRSDRKFVATANSGDCKASILEAVDFKWWGWKDALKEVGIEVVFIDVEAAELGYKGHTKHERSAS